MNPLSLRAAALSSVCTERQTGLSPSVSLVKNSYEKQVLESNAKLTYYFVHIRLNVLNILVDLLADFIQTTGEFLLSGRLLFQCRKSLRRAVAHQPFAMITSAPRAIPTKDESGSSAGKSNNNL